MVGTPRQIEGRDEVAVFFNGSARAALPVLVDDRPGAAWFHRGEARVVFDFTVRDGLVRAITFRAARGALASRATQRLACPRFVVRRHEGGMTARKVIMPSALGRPTAPIVRPYSPGHHVSCFGKYHRNRSTGS